MHFHQAVNTQYYVTALNNHFLGLSNPHCEPVSIHCLPPLQSDIGPFPHNQTGSNTSGVPEEGGTSGGPEGLADRGPRAGADRPWRMEDLEGELERKVELLDKERKALRLETEKHRQEIDRGINKLHHRVSGLEEGWY